MDKSKTCECWTLWLTVLLVTLAIGCRDAKTISAAESQSPDGQWIALARTDQYSGPGTAGILSTVSLRQVKGRQDRIEVLQLSHDTISVDLKMNWITPSHLEITYRQPASVDFQAIKCGGIDVSVRALSNAGTNTSTR